MLDVFRGHWPEYLIEAAGLCFFMISACAFATLLFHPVSPLPTFITDPTLRRFLMGIAMGLTAIAIIYSPWGKRSGAHINPSVTLTFYRLGKVEPWDALFYILAQFAGGIVGVLIAVAILGGLLADPHVNYVTTMPGPAGQAIAFLAEALISFLLMMVVLAVSNNRRLSRWTGLFAGTLVAIYISFESPFSGMSMNPARTFGSALSARAWTSLWIYFTAPPLGMLLAAHIYTRIKGKQAMACAKLHHRNKKRCIFRCGYEQQLMGVQGLRDRRKERLFLKTPIAHLKGDLNMRHVMLFVSLIVLVVAIAVAEAGVVSAQQPASTKFKVRIENISNPDGYAASNGMKWPFALSPGLFVVDTEGVSLFTEGQKASGNGLESQAEDGNPSALVNSLESSHHSSNLHGVFNMPVGASAPGPIGPGGAYEFTLTATRKMKLTLLMMFGQSNDLFYAPAKPIELFNAKCDPLSGDITSSFMLYDAGTEADQEPGIGSDQAPRQNAPNTGADENGVVHKAREQVFYTKTAELFRITITPEAVTQ